MIKWSRSLKDEASTVINELLFSDQVRHIPRDSCLKGLIDFQPIPYNEPLREIEACIEERAAELSNREPAVLFSGGVDSSLALVSLAVSKERSAEKLIAIVTDETYRVLDPRLERWLVSKGCVFEKLEKPDSLKALVEKHGFVVTGTHGDNLFLGDYAYRKNLVERVWGMSVLEMLSEVSGRSLPKKAESYYSRLFEDMPSWMDRSPANCLWWVAFYGQWHWATCYLTGCMNIGKPGETHDHFFGSNSIQRWMMQDANLRCGKTSSTHKKIAKDLICEIVGERIELKDKTGGWDQIISNSGMERVLVADKNWNMQRCI